MQHDFSEFDSADNMYRLLLYNKVYTKLHLSLADKRISTLFRFCCHQNINSLKYDFNGREIISIQDLQHLLKSKLDNTTLECKTDQYKRLLYNRQEYGYLNSNNLSATECPDSENEFRRVSVSLKLSPKEIIEDRSICLYFRRETEYKCHNIQLDYFQFIVIAYTIDYLIKNNNLTFFNRLKLVSREAGVYPHFIHKMIPSIEYINATGHDFLYETTAFTNTIYLTHCSYLMSKFSIPIFSNSMILDDERRVVAHAKLNLWYDIDNSDDVVLNNGTFKSLNVATATSTHGVPEVTIDSIIDSTIEAMYNLEGQMNKLI